MADEKKPDAEEQDERLQIEKEKLGDLDVQEEHSEDVKGGARGVSLAGPPACDG